MSEYVTIELAKKLKEKGFPQGNKDDITEKYYTISDSLTAAMISANGEDVKWYCPTIGQVLKCLREEKKIHIGVLYHGYYAVWIQPMKRNEAEHVIHDCKTYEEAELEGIEFVLDNLI